MDVKKAAITNGTAHLDTQENTSSSKEHSIITFSPNRTRFDSTSSRRSSIPEDLQKLEVVNASGATLNQNNFLLEETVPATIPVTTMTLKPNKGNSNIKSSHLDFFEETNTKLKSSLNTLSNSIKKNGKIGENSAKEPPNYFDCLLDSNEITLFNSDGCEAMVEDLHEPSNSSGFMFDDSASVSKDNSWLHESDQESVIGGENDKLIDDMPTIEPSLFRESKVIGGEKRSEIFSPSKTRVAVEEKKLNEKKAKRFSDVDTSSVKFSSSFEPNRRHILVPVKRLAIPPRHGKNVPGSCSGEEQPLVEYESGAESDGEVPFFPEKKSKAHITDNMSVDQMSLSEDEDDLHLSPPTPLTRRCPCDPRGWAKDTYNLLGQTNRPNSKCIIS